MSSVELRPHAHEVHSDSGGQGLSHQSRASAALVLGDTSDNVHRPAEVVLGAVNRPIEV